MSRKECGRYLHCWDASLNNLRRVEIIFQNCLISCKSNLFPISSSKCCGFLKLLLLLIIHKEFFWIAQNFPKSVISFSSCSANKFPKYFPQSDSHSVMISGIREFRRRIFTDTTWAGKIEVMIIIFRRRTPPARRVEKIGLWLDRKRNRDGNQHDFIYTFTNHNTFGINRDGYYVIVGNGCHHHHHLWVSSSTIISSPQKNFCWMRKLRYLSGGWLFEWVVVVVERDKDDRFAERRKSQQQSMPLVIRHP